MTLAEKIINFNKRLSINDPVPKGIEVMNPYQDKVTFSLSERFYLKYYSDQKPRSLILGINPGRFGGGLTGIPFTDPIKLENNCGIENNLPKKAELSADFIYRMIDQYGGPEKFYAKFYVSAVSPLGFTKNGKNLNYYDIKELKDNLHNFIVTTLAKQLDFGLNREVCYCLGEGENFKFLSALNESYRFFNDIIALAHPRFIMQYQRKKVEAYIKKYLEKLTPEKIN